MARVAILVGSKGRGSNMLALIRECPDWIRLVVSPQAGTPAVAGAESAGVSVATLDPADPMYSARLLQTLAKFEIDFVCLAGFMRILPAEVVRKFEGRILNIHPALLPKFGGKGMYGIHIHKAVLAAGESRSGCTVHYVNEVYDEGPVLLQVSCPVYPDDDPERLAARVLLLEHAAYPLALRLAIDRSQHA